MKPTYTTTKRAIWINAGLAWAVILLLVISGVAGSEQAVALAGIALPSMVALIAGTIGIHRHYGSRDFAASHEPPDADPAGGAP